jgi:hypothetical protein
MQPLDILTGIYATYDEINLAFISYRLPTFGMVVQIWMREGSNMLANIAFTRGNDHPTCLLVLLVSTGLYSVNVNNG